MAFSEKPNDAVITIPTLPKRNLKPGTTDQMATIHAFSNASLYVGALTPPPPGDLGKRRAPVCRGRATPESLQVQRATPESPHF